MCQLALLGRWNLQHQAVEIGRNSNLTAQARISLHMVGEIEHLCLHILRFTDNIKPFGIHVDMTCGAGTRTTTLGGNTRYRVPDRDLHDGGTHVPVTIINFAIVRRKCNLYHIDRISFVTLGSATFRFEAPGGAKAPY